MTGRFPAVDPGRTSGIGRRRESARDENNAAYRRRRAEIIRAAAEAFKAKGFRATSLADVAKAADTDRATLYYYVANKTDLFDAVVRDVVERNADRAEEIRAGTDPAPVKLRRMLVELMASYADNYPFLYVYVQENLSQVAPDRAGWSQQMRTLNRRYEDALIGVIADGVAEGTLRVTGDPRIAAYGLLGMLAWTNRWFRPERDDVPPAEEIAGTFADLALHGLVVPAADEH